MHVAAVRVRDEDLRLAVTRGNEQHVTSIGRPSRRRFALVARDQRFRRGGSVGGHDPDVGVALPARQIRRRADERHEPSVRRELGIRDADRGQQILNRHRPRGLCARWYQERHRARDRHRTQTFHEMTSIVLILCLFARRTLPRVSPSSLVPRPASLVPRPLSRVPCPASLVEGRWSRVPVRPDDHRPCTWTGRGPRDLDEGPGTRDPGRGTWTRDPGRGTRDEGPGTKD